MRLSNQSSSLRRLSTGRKEGIICKADSRGASYETAVRNCVSKVLEQLNGVEPSLTILWLYDGQSSSDPLSCNAIMAALPLTFRANLIGAVVAPHDDGVPPLELSHPPMRWAGLHCFSAGNRVDTFHSQNDSLPPLNYKELLAAEDLAFILLSNSSMQHDALVTRLDSLFPSAPKVFAALRTDRLILGEEVVDGTVGAILRGAPDGDSCCPTRRSRLSAIDEAIYVVSLSVILP
jgi:hypothetical protein